MTRRKEWDNCVSWFSCLTPVILTIISSKLHVKLLHTHSPPTSLFRPFNRVSKVSRIHVLWLLLGSSHESFHFHFSPSFDSRVEVTWTPLYPVVACKHRIWVLFYLSPSPPSPQAFHALFQWLCFTDYSMCAVIDAMHHPSPNFSLLFLPSSLLEISVCRRHLHQHLCTRNCTVQCNSTAFPLLPELFCAPLIHEPFFWPTCHNLFSHSSSTSHEFWWWFGTRSSASQEKRQQTDDLFSLILSCCYCLLCFSFTSKSKRNPMNLWSNWSKLHSPHFCSL